jgi:hypothetical protein
MLCKYHLNHEATHTCTTCGVPLCDACSQTVFRGNFYCSRCVIFLGVLGVNLSERDESRPRGPFIYFLIACLMSLLVMMGVTLPLF